MMQLAGVEMVAAVLMLLLLLLGFRGASAARQLRSRPDTALLAAEISPCPPEFVSRIFSPADWEFVSQTKSSELREFFRRERKQVALLWIQQTSATIQGIMREHARAARGKADLEFTTEASLIFHYAQLMLVCGVLLIAIRSFGPSWLRGLALYADSLTQRIAQTQLGLQTATTVREIQSVGPS
jgi:hypothetical protein